MTPASDLCNSDPRMAMYSGPLSIYFTLTSEPSEYIRFPSACSATLGLHGLITSKRISRTSTSTKAFDQAPSQWRLRLPFARLLHP